MKKPTKKRIIKITIITIATIVTLGILGFAFFFYVGFLMNTRHWVDPNWDSSHRIIEDTFQAEQNTQDWKTYRNEEFGFEVKLPLGCEFEEEKALKKGFTNGSFSMDLKCLDLALTSRNLVGFLHISVYPNFNKRKEGERGALNKDQLNAFCGIGSISYLSLEIKQPISRIPLCYQNLQFGYTTYNYNFVRDNVGYRFSIIRYFTNSRSNPKQPIHSDDIKTEKAILESFRFIDIK